MTIQYSTIQNPAKRYCNINDIELHDLRVDTIHHSAIYQIEVHKHILYIYICSVFEHVSNAMAESKKHNKIMIQYTKTLSTPNCTVQYHEISYCIVLY